MFICIVHLPPNNMPTTSLAFKMKARVQAQYRRTGWQQFGSLHWVDVTFGGPDLRLCQVTYQELQEASPLVVTRSLIVREDGSWVLHVNGHLVNPDNVPSLHSFPPLLSRDSISLLLSQLGDLRTCVGNPEQKYVALGEAKKKEQFLSEGRSVVAYVDRNACVVVNEQKYASTIRCSKCHVLTSNVRCSVCTTYRRSLNAQCSRAARLSNHVQSKNINYR